MSQPTTQNVVAWAFGGHRFVFLFPDHEVPQILHQLGRYAADPEFPDFTWEVAIMLSNRVRRLVDGKGAS